MCRCISWHDVVCDALLVMLLYVISYYLMYASMVCYVVVLNTVMILCIECIVCRICFDMFFKQTSAIHSPSHGCRLLLRDLTTVVIRLLSVGLEKEAGQGRTYSQDVGSSPTKELNWACGKKDEHGFLVHPGRLTWNRLMEVWFRSFSFLNG